MRDAASAHRVGVAQPVSSWQWMPRRMTSPARQNLEHPVQPFVSHRTTEAPPGGRDDQSARRSRVVRIPVEEAPHVDEHAPALDEEGDGVGHHGDVEGRPYSPPRGARQTWPPGSRRVRASLAGHLQVSCTFTPALRVAPKRPAGVAQRRRSAEELVSLGMARPAPDKPTRSRRAAGRPPACRRPSTDALALGPSRRVVS